MNTGIIPYGARVIVAVSGGADSTALLQLLYRSRHALALDLIVAHYDHALRRGSARDLRFVQQMSRALGLRCVSERNCSKCPPGMSVEDFARGQRFDFFIRTAKALKAAAVILAHTQDDLAETVLMRILRGAGLCGLRSILPARHMQGVLFLRPMLDMTRADVEMFLKKEGIGHTQDPTNAGDDFLRNRIRHQLIPYLAREFAPAVKEKLAELASSSSVDYDFLEAELGKLLPRALTVRGGKVRIGVKLCQGLHPAMRRMLLRAAAGRLKRAPGGLSFQHVAALERIILDGRNGRLTFPSGIAAVVTDKFITLA